MSELYSKEDLLEMIELAKKGDESSFEKLYYAFLEPVLRFISIRVPSTEDAEDLTQQVFVKFYKNLNNWQYQGYSPLAYVFTIARTSIADYWRKNKNRPIENSEEVLPLVMDSSKRPDELALSKDSAADIVRAIRRLPANYQEVVSLRLIDGLTNPEISQIINKSEVATRKLYSRGIQKLRIELKGTNNE